MKEASNVDPEMLSHPKTEVAFAYYTAGCWVVVVVLYSLLQTHIFPSNLIEQILWLYRTKLCS